MIHQKSQKHCYLYWRRVKPYPIRKMMNLLTFDNLFPPLAKTRGRATTATTFSRQNDTDSRSRALFSVRNLVLIVVLVWESKDVEWDD